MTKEEEIEIELARMKQARDSLLITNARLHGEIDRLRETPEDEEFNRIERESKQRTEAVKYAINSAFKSFEPDWANFNEGRAAGRSEAFEEIGKKIKTMPFENDTMNSLLLWLKEQE
jgi:hypothetical protein